MLIGNSVTSVDSANANRNLPVLDAQTGDRKTNNEDRTQPTSAAAADKVTLSGEAKAISKSKDDQEKSKVSDKELTQTLKKPTVDVEGRAEKAINHAVRQLRAGTIDEKKFTRKLDKIASEQSNGLLTAMKVVQDQDSKETRNTAAENKAPVDKAPENKAPKNTAPENTAVKVAAAKMAASGIGEPEKEEKDPYPASKAEPPAMKSADQAAMLAESFTDAIARKEEDEYQGSGFVIAGSKESSSSFEETEDEKLGDLGEKQPEKFQIGLNAFGSSDRTGITFGPVVTPLGKLGGIGSVKGSNLSVLA